MLRQLLPEERQEKPQKDEDLPAPRHQAFKRWPAASAFEVPTAAEWTYRKAQPSCRSSRTRFSSCVRFTVLVRANH